MRQSFSVALEPILELVLVDQAGLKLKAIRLHLPGIKSVYHHHLAQDTYTITLKLRISSKTPYTTLQLKSPNTAIHFFPSHGIKITHLKTKLLTF